MATNEAAVLKAFSDGLARDINKLPLQQGDPLTPDDALQALPPAIASMLRDKMQPDRWRIYPDTINDVTKVCDRGDLQGYMPDAAIVTDPTMRANIAAAKYVGSLLARAMRPGASNPLHGLVQAGAPIEASVDALRKLMEKSGTTTLGELNETLKLVDRYTEGNYGVTLKTEANRLDRLDRLDQIMRDASGEKKVCDFLKKLAALEDKASFSWDKNYGHLKVKSILSRDKDTTLETAEKEIDKISDKDAVNDSRGKPVNDLKGRP